MITRNICKRIECDLASTIALNGEEVPKFGCSDCNCNSHLIYFKRKRDAMNSIKSAYEKLDMDAFIRRIGGQERIEAMKKVNEKLDRSELINGKLVEKKQPVNENLDEWKKGFMEGYDEAYRRLMNR